MYEILYEKQVEASTWEEQVVGIVELSFSLVYVLEMAAKIRANSWVIYWSQFRNKFDGVITIITILGECGTKDNDEFSAFFAKTGLGQMWGRTHKFVFAGEIVVHMPDGIADELVGHGHGVVRFFTLLRTLRVLRLLSSIPQFALIFQSISELTTVFVRLGSVLMVIMVFFGQVGILLFGAANSHHFLSFPHVCPEPVLVQ